jgi:hypothetical protein
MKSLPRRTLLHTIGLALAAGATRRTTAGEAVRTPLEESETAAKAIGYVADAKKVNVATSPTYRRGQSCTTCSFVEIGTAPRRGCSLVPGRLVNAAGWCKVWKLRGSS